MRKLVNRLKVCKGIRYVLPCIKNVDRPVTKCVKNPNVVCDHVLADTELNIMEDVDWHDRSWVDTEFSVVGVLGCMSEII